MMQAHLKSILHARLLQWYTFLSLNFAIRLKFVLLLIWIRTFIYVQMHLERKCVSMCPERALQLKLIISI